MLRTLRIRDLAIADDVTVEFGAGLNVLTGETGAGKSVVVDALGLVAGARADRTLVRGGADRAVIEALFEAGHDPELEAWVADRGLGPLEERQLLLRREVATAGAGRAFLNGSPITLALLREAGVRLVELHGQHEHLRLVDPERQLELLDRFGRHEALVAAVVAAHDAVRDAERDLDAWRERARSREERIEEARRQAAEVAVLAPRAGEIEALDRERTLLRSHGRVVELLTEILALTVDGDPAAAALVGRAARRAEELALIDPRLAEAAARLRAAQVEVEDVAAGFRDLEGRVDFEPGRLDALETRRAELERACRRHATDEAGLLALGQRAAEALEALEDLEGRLERASAGCRRTVGAWVAAAGALSEARAGAARRLAAEVTRQLGDLALGRAAFDARSLGEPGGEPVVTRHGAERVEFLLAANPGEPARPLAAVASGGELSRILLALHVSVGGDRGPEVAVFDEVDAGIGGGAVADAVGARLAALARDRQVLCVTHLPQIAAWADRHLSVTKQVRGGRTELAIEELGADGRVDELARMLGGRQVGETSRRHAAELLAAAGRPAAPVRRRRA